MGKNKPDRRRAAQPSAPRPESLAFPSSRAPRPHWRRGIVSSRMKRMASQEPANGEPSAAPDAVLNERQPRVLRAGRRKAAVAPQRRGQQHLIAGDQRHNGSSRPAHTALRGNATRASFNSAISVANGRSSTARFAITMSATPVGAALRVTRKASRRRRRAGCAAPLRGSVGSLRTPRVADHPSRATVRQTTDDQHACLAERAPESRRWWSTARCGGIGRLHGQPFAPLRPTALQHLPPALRFHTLAEAMRLGPPTAIRLKRALHVGDSPSDGEAEVV